jgi:ABC-2 type transport system permease protein
MAPVIQLILLGYAATLDIKHISIVVCDKDKSFISRELINKFTASNYFYVYEYTEDIDTVEKYLIENKARGILVIPPGFQKKMISNQKPELQVIIDGSDANTATIGLNYMNIVINNYLNEKVKKMSIDMEDFKIASISPLPRVWFNPELKSSNFMVPNVLCMLLMVITMVLSSMAIVREKEIGTMEQIIVTPIKTYQLIIGKLVPFVIIGFVIEILVICVAYFWFKVPFRGNLPLLLGLSGVFLLSTLGLGIFISTISKTQQQAMMTSAFGVILPMVYLSGFIFPIENMPTIIQYLTYLIPLRYFISIIRSIFLKGIGIFYLWDEFLALLVFGIIILTLSILRFKKTLD